MLYRLGIVFLRYLRHCIPSIIWYRTKFFVWFSLRSGSVWGSNKVYDKVIRTYLGSFKFLTIQFGIVRDILGEVFLANLSMLLRNQKSNVAFKINLVLVYLRVGRYIIWCAIYNIPHCSSVCTVLWIGSCQAVELFSTHFLTGAKPILPKQWESFFYI